MRGRTFLCGSPQGMESQCAMNAYCLLYDMKLHVDRHLNEHERSVVLVISPLVSLMVDQVSSLRSRGVAAAILSSRRSID
jgi:hypothetical protein